MASKKLQKLKESPTAAYVDTVHRAHNKKRRSTSLEVSDPELKGAIDSALKSLATSSARVVGLGRRRVRRRLRRPWPS